MEVTDAAAAEIALMSAFDKQVKRMKLLFGLIARGRFDQLRYLLRNCLKGLDLRWVSVEDLGLSADQANWYSDSGGPALARVLKALKIPGGARALDIGSGKRGAVFTLSEFPFVEIVGIEISLDLVRIAEINATKLRLRHVRFVCADAATFTEFDRFTHIYMYNPFPCAIMRSVMDNLRASLARKPRGVTLIYKGPACHNTIIDSGLFRAEREFGSQDSPSSVFRIYLNNAADDIRSVG